jgi:hypothetical protein
VATAAMAVADCNNGNNGSSVDGGGDDSSCGDGDCDSNSGSIGNGDSHCNSEATKTMAATGMTGGEIQQSTKKGTMETAMGTVIAMITTSMQTPMTVH